MYKGVRCSSPQCVRTIGEIRRDISSVTLGRSSRSHLCRENCSTCWLSSAPLGPVSFHSFNSLNLFVIYFDSISYMLKKSMSIFQALSLGAHPRPAPLQFLVSLHLPSSPFPSISFQSRAKLQSAVESPL